MCLAILAEDLSAAADCALPAMRLGARTCVRLTRPDRETLDDWDVVAWDLDTRRLAGDGAAARIGRAARQLGADDTLYLNVGSAPRRNVGRAIDAALTGSGRRVAVFAPALPALDRITASGRQHAPTWPATGIDLIGRLRASSRAHVVPVGLAAVHNGGLARTRGRQPFVILACDATTGNDLEQIVASGARLDEPVVWVGSTALATPLIASVLDSPAAPLAARPGRRGPVLVVVGGVARPIEARLRALRSVLRLVPVEVDSLALACGGERAQRAIDEAAGAVARALAVGADAALFARGSEPGLAVLCARIAHGLGAVTRAALDRARPGGLVLTGAQTARAVCDALGIAAMELVGEIAPGVPLGRTVGDALGHAATPPLDVVARAGTFADRLSLVRALGAFERAAA
jgi:D-threonate/D-erythronate kinase